MARLSPGSILETIPAWALGLGVAPWDPPLTIVGASLQISDDSDASYADIDYDGTAYPTEDPAPHAIVADFGAATIEPGSSITASLRAQFLDPGILDGLPVQLQMYAWLIDRTGPEYLMSFIGNFGLVYPVEGGPPTGHDYFDGEIATVTLPWDYEGTSLIDAFAAGNASIVIFVNNGNAALTTARVFEFWFDVAGEIVGIAPPRRQYPRDDGLAGGSPRLWPPPQSRQLSIQQNSYL